MLTGKFKGYDIIGDVHGCADTLVHLLERLGYRKQAGVFHHPSRQALFVGDIVDRGPHIREALHLVYDMTEHDSARIVMGNHEYNAIGYSTEAPPGFGQKYLRDHNDRHTRLIAETLEQMANHPADWQCFLEWFQTLPLFLETSGIRVVHACWDCELIDDFKRRYGTNRVDKAFIVNSIDRNSYQGRVMDRLTRGTDMKIPGGVVLRGRDGYERRFFRTKFWAQNPKTYRDIVFQPDPLPDSIADQRLSDDDRKNLLTYGADEAPVFVGHYWLQGRPKPILPNLACLDYSAVKYGRLVAYRYDGEAQLSAEKFVWVHVDPPEWRGMVSGERF